MARTASYHAPRRLNTGSHTRKVSMHKKHRRTGAHKGFTRRVRGKLFRGRTVNAARTWW